MPLLEQCRFIDPLSRIGTAYALLRDLRVGVPIVAAAAVSRLLFRQSGRAIFAFGFAKSRKANRSQADLAVLREEAAVALGWNDEDMDRLVSAGAMTEI